MENLTLSGLAINGTGNAASNTIIGNDQGNNLKGGGGNDNLQGGLGADILEGETGNDILSGGSGDDTYITDGNDTINESPDDGIDTVKSSGSYMLVDNLENLTLQELQLVVQATATLIRLSAMARLTS